jgi:hypothetical protein
MTRGHASAERIIPAPAAEVYALLADYHNGHPSILPPAFSDFAVLDGGVGAGTRIRFRLTRGGRVREVEARVEEPEPGRVLSEHYPQNDTVTTFTVDPAVGGSRLRIETTWTSRGGLGGFLERWFAPRLLARLYGEELDLIEHWARGRTSA